MKKMTNIQRNEVTKMKRNRHQIPNLQIQILNGL